MEAIRAMVDQWPTAMATETLGMALELALAVEVGVLGGSRTLAVQGAALAKGGLNSQRANFSWAGWTMPPQRRACTNIVRSGESRQFRCFTVIYCRIKWRYGVLENVIPTLPTTCVGAGPGYRRTTSSVLQG